MNWTGHDTSLVVWAVIGIALVVVLITQFKVHPFLALILGSGLTGLGAGWRWRSGPARCSCHT